MPPKVKLLRPDGKVIEFRLDHAERILTMRDNGGWVLQDEKYELVGNEIVRKRTKRTA